MNMSRIMGLILLILLAMVISFIVGQRVGLETNGACHSKTEDSAPYDCNFTRISPIRGVWTKK